MEIINSKDTEYENDKYDFEIEKLTDHVKNLVLENEKQAFSQEKVKLNLLYEDLLNPAENELNTKNTLLCAICGNVPMAPIMQCEECECMYCNEERCLLGVT